MKAKGKYNGYVTILLFALAATLLIFSTVGSSRAALTYISDYYQAEVEMQDIGVALLENGTSVASRTYNDTRAEFGWDVGGDRKLLTRLVPLDGSDATEDAMIVPGKVYQEELAVQNTGTIDSYVRVSIYRYWVDQGVDPSTGTAQHRTDLNPEFIRLSIPARDTNAPNNGWVWDADAETTERTVLYRQAILPCAEGSNVSATFADKISVDDEALYSQLDAEQKTVVETLPDGTTQTTYYTYYTYDGAVFVLQVDVDAVQTHNAYAAIQSAWGLTRDKVDALGIVIPAIN